MTKIESLIKHNHIIQRIYITLGSLFFKFLGLFIRQDESLILFSSFGGKNFNDSPKLIFEEISNKYGNKFKYVWAFLNPNDFKVEGAKNVKINSFKYFVYALKAKFWVTNVNIERGLHFQKKGCIYLNTWHGVCLDYIGNDREDRNDYDFKKLSYLCVSGSFDENIYKTAFKAKKSQFLECGMPRNDCLLNGTLDSNKIKKELGIPLDKKIILYAPTWREDFSTKTDSDFVSPIHIEKWKEIFGDEFIFLFRAHSITKNVFNIEFDNFCIDVSDYPNTNEILFITDILITDYSSICIDFALLNRPFFNFGFDFEEYKQRHGFYVDYESEMPNGIIKTESDLLEKVAKVKDILFQDNHNLIDKYLNFTFGNSTDICVEKLFSYNLKGEEKQ